MNNTVKFILTFIVSGTVMFLIFYFYPAKIFDVEISNQVVDKSQEIHLKAFLGLDERFDIWLKQHHYEMKRKLSGWMILLICTIGLPAMIALRTTVSRKNEE